MCTVLAIIATVIINLEVRFFQLIYTLPSHDTYQQHNFVMVNNAIAARHFVSRKRRRKGYAMMFRFLFPCIPFMVLLASAYAYAFTNNPQFLSRNKLKLPLRYKDRLQHRFQNDDNLDKTKRKRENPYSLGLKPFKEQKAAEIIKESASLLEVVGNGTEGLKGVLKDQNETTTATANETKEELSLLPKNAILNDSNSSNSLLFNSTKVSSGMRQNESAPFLNEIIQLVPKPESLPTNTNLLAQTITNSFQFFDFDEKQSRSTSNSNSKKKALQNTITPPSHLKAQTFYDSFQFFDFDEKEDAHKALMPKKSTLKGSSKQNDLLAKTISDSFQFLESKDERSKSAKLKKSPSKA